MAAIGSGLGAFSNLWIRGTSDDGKRASYTLTMSIGGFFSVLIVVLGIVLVAYGYERSKGLARLTATQLFDDIFQQTADGLSAIYGPVETAVYTTGTLAASGSESLEERLTLLGYLAESLRANDRMNAIFIGYEDGDFILVCGKVTTPEYIVDKTTKLETIYNRIHEIRMRFEVLLRDAHIDYYRALAAGDDDQARLQNKLDADVEQIKDDLELIAECNVGAELITPEQTERIRQIAQRTWVLNLNDRTGISSDEVERKRRSPELALRVEEPLLEDKDEHLVFRRDGGSPWGKNPYGFRMDVPEHEYNFGEIYNLCISRGTLTNEERFKINEHMTQTIMMLCSLPFPKALRRVPDWAASHHEKLDGTGYPRRLDAVSLGVHERIVAIADVFEALTAADRPYKKSKTLSETLYIMSRMRDSQHICPELFDLFLQSDIHTKYAEEFLLPEQIDEVDATAYMSDRARELQLAV